MWFGSCEITKHDFDVTRLASVLEKGAKLYRNITLSLKYAELLLIKSISQKPFSENTIKLY